MDTRQAYNIWASQYDTNINKTRDLEAVAFRDTLSSISIKNCLEVGCGTGKNTAWLVDRAQHVTAIDLSEQMLATAKIKINAPNVEFKQTDILLPWSFGSALFDLVTFSLVLEHIEDLDPVFKEASLSLIPGGYVYVGELHPFKQYTGSKARFETEHGTQFVPCFNHHISDFTEAARKNGLVVQQINEYFDEPAKKKIPRILTMLLKKPG